MKFKRILIFLLVAAFMTAMPLSAAAEEKKPTVIVTVSNGEICVGAESVPVEDVDNDGVYSIADALYCAHDLYYEGGAARGFAAEETKDGLSVTKLWGVKNGGAYGFFLNHAPAEDLSAPVTDGDLLDAFAYTDLDGLSDRYTYFELQEVKGDYHIFILYGIEYAEDGSYSFTPVSKASITANGNRVNLTTNEDGVVKLPLISTGHFLVSAVSPRDDVIIVPPTYWIDVDKDTAEAQRMNNIFVIVIVIAVAAIVVREIVRRKKRS